MRKRWKKRLAAVIIAMTLLLSSFGSMTALAGTEVTAPSGTLFLKTMDVTASGTCGDNLTWELTSDGTLTISGTGAMGTYDENKFPWYNYRTSISYVKIEGGVTSIYAYAFRGCYYLENVSISEGVVSIGSYAFYGCIRLTDITIPSSVVSIGSYAFYGCSSLKSIVLSENLSTINSHTFEGCSELTDITIPESVTVIELYAFEDCVSLSNVILNEGLTSIGQGAFQGCTSLSDIVIPETVTSIRTYAFYNCTGLTDVTLSNGVESIGSYAFAYCTFLEEIEVPESVTSMGSSAFEYCTSLASAVIEAEFSTLGSYTFAYCTNLREVTIPFSVTTVSNYCFTGCNSLTDVYYTGTALKWNSISFNSGNTYLTEADIHYVDCFSFLNSPDEFSDTYYISSDDNTTLLSNLSAVERMSILTGLSLNVGGLLVYADSWEGSCYGMSAWVYLNMLGERSASDMNASASELYDENIKSSLPVQSAINFYHVQQYLSTSVANKEAFMLLSQTSQLDLLESYLEAGSPVFLQFQWYKADSSGLQTTTLGKVKEAGHAVVAYALEEGDYTEYVESYLGERTMDKEFTHRVLLYDSAASYGGSAAYYIYYSEDGIWCIPGRYIISTSSQSREKSVYNNGQLVLATADADAVNAVDYVTGAYAGSSSTADEMLNYLTMPAGGLDLTWASESAEIDGFSVVSNSSDEDIHVMFDASTTDAGTDATTAIVTLPEAESYTVTPDADTIEVTLTAGDYLTSAEADTDGRVMLLADGGAEVTTEETASIMISVTANEGCTDLPWSTVEVAAEETTDLSAELTEDGLVITGDNLADVTISAESEDGTDTAQTTLSTEEDTVLLTADEDGSIEITEDYESNESGSSGDSDVGSENAGSSSDISGGSYDTGGSDTDSEISSGSGAASGNETGTLQAQKITIKKAALKKTIKYKKLKKKNVSFKLKAVSSGNGKITYKKTKGSKKIKVSKNGKVTVKKGLKIGKYKVKVKTSAAKTSTYKKKSVTKTLTIKVQ